MADNPWSGVYEFAEFRLLAAQRRLVARADGRPIDLTQKAFDALLYLVRRPGELLDKATLLKAIWPNLVVEENNLNQVILDAAPRACRRPRRTALHRHRAGAWLPVRRGGP
jgi:DNA-binding response OmpR family regulator